MKKFPKYNKEDLKNINFKRKLKDSTILRILQGKEISLDEYKNLKLNSYERKAIYPLLSPEALTYATENCLKNSSIPDKGRFSAETTYDEAIVNILSPLLLDKMQELLRENKNLKTKLEKNHASIK